MLEASDGAHPVTDDQPSMTTRQRLVKLSKFLALLLRHRPEEFGLELDEAGWASLPAVLEVLDGLPNFRWVDRSDVVEVVRKGTGDDKKRFQVENDRIRALYGHSLDQRIQYDAERPPECLYHGTSPGAVETIRRGGLKPMGRQYVHLSPDRETAFSVGSRHASRPAVIRIQAREAHEAGITFYHPQEGIYLSEAIPPRFLELPE